MTSAFSARGPDDTVAGEALPVPGWAPLPHPAEVPNLFVFVHGYNVPFYREHALPFVWNSYVHLADALRRP